MSSDTPPITNLLLNALPLEQRKSLLSVCEQVELKFGTVVCAANQPYQYVYFPLNGFISQIAVIDDHTSLELGLIGNEGMLGASLALGVGDAPLHAIVQGTGELLRIPANSFVLELSKNQSLSSLLLHYIYVVMRQMAQTAACIHFHEITPRLARWLLMSHDRAHESEFLLTHNFLARMLGVRRSGVSVAAKLLQDKNLITYVRGKIHILDRQGLEAESCECYQTMAEFYQRM